ncbi:transcription initiation factor IIB [Coemansia sp. RSA 1813]|nr:transcription initiation factor IIB [Coemansia sp. RSA 1646]KAJ1770747.1 transcription initiation factor IIB [Coemansia sp. RSA 1843]KAJ2088767.1 transcription initiation factor IIB [Coemansia sp. RSA 986]KAJ2213703.1 transcription initiation factor IIB [Coemansia sp. RSA 487]KAJ2568694.1 transcription initiation factor IIB [Coemansia sp. RSA 1813]
MTDNYDDQFSVKLICKDCRSLVPNLVEDFTSGDYVCGDCGLVLGDRIVDTRSEWRTFQDSDGPDQSRVGDAANPFLDGDQLDTVIGGDKGLGNSRGLHRTQARTGAPTKGNQTLGQAYKDISAFCDMCEMPRSIADASKHLYQKVESEYFSQKGRKANVLITACIFSACRQEGVPRTYKEICSLTGVNRKDVRKVFTLLRHIAGTRTTVTSSEDLIMRFSSRLDLDNSVSIVVRMLSQKAKDLDNISGKNPITIAGACIYFVSQLFGKDCNAESISTVTGISESTIKSTHRILYENRKTILTPEILSRCPQAAENSLRPQ